MTLRILIGDVRDKLRELPDESVDCVVTSPPYYGLRDYGVAGQIGLEQSPAEYVETLVAVFHEVRRVLRKNGTLWLNLGDSYAGSWGAQSRRVTDSDEPSWHSSQIKNHPKRASNTGTIRTVGVKPKDLYGIPWMVAFALRADGWWLRQDIIWSKPNPMPESVTDRCTKAHEYLFLLSKSERYWFDANAIAEPALQPVGNPFEATGRGYQHKQNAIGQQQGITSTLGANHGANTRNRRSVWTVTTQPYAEAHFATFPPALVEPCILAGCPKGGTVLDPFGGAGTTGLVADRLGRDAILIELSPAYAEMARRRISDDMPALFATEVACH